MSKRDAIRIGNPNSLESLLFTIERYGEIEKETYDEIVAWLKQHPDKYSFECIDEPIGIGVTVPTIKVIRKGSFIFKILDNQHDAENTLANIRNKDFPNNKQGQ
jgi:hypothetical protein